MHHGESGGQLETSGRILQEPEQQAASPPSDLRIGEGTVLSDPGFCDALLK